MRLRCNNTLSGEATFSGEATLPFLFCNHSQWGQLFKGSICSPSQFFPLRGDPILSGHLHLEKYTDPVPHLYIYSYMVLCWDNFVFLCMTWSPENAPIFSISSIDDQDDHNRSLVLILPIFELIFVLRQKTTPVCFENWHVQIKEICNQTNYIPAGMKVKYVGGILAGV